jgi:RNA polymerase sigma-70 factor (ECF subfamily)
MWRIFSILVWLVQKMDHSLQDDIGLLGLMKQGDVAAFTELYNRHWKSLYISARNVLRVQEAAKDVVQEVFASLWQNKDHLDIKYPKAYLHQAVRFQVLKAIRSDKISADFYHRLTEASNEIIIENHLLFKELQHIVAELVQSLPEDCRQAFLLSREQNLSYNQIAEQLNISVKTVEKKMSRSLRFLRTGLGKSIISLYFQLAFIYLQRFL